MGSRFLRERSRNCPTQVALLLAFHRDPSVATSTARRWAIDISDLVGWHFLMLRGFHPEVVETVVRFADKDAEEVFWDIGANKGACSYQVAHALPKCKIVAVEPQKDLIPNLSANLQVVAEGRADVFPVGIGEKSEISFLYIPKQNTGAASLLPPVEFPLESNGIEIRIETAEWVVRNSRFGWPTLVKIDVEGFEPTVIKSLLPAFESSFIKCCVFECRVSKKTASNKYLEMLQTSDTRLTR